MSENDSDLSENRVPQPFAEGSEFYIEDGCMVLTEKFLKERGFCCGNKCRHCPYGWINVPNQSR